MQDAGTGNRYAVSDVSQEFSTSRQCDLGEILAFAEQLEDLSLNFIRHDWNIPKPHQRMVDFSEIAGNQTWKHLKRLALNRIDIIRPLEFHQVLSRHSKTLRSLTLYDFCVFDNSWMEFFTEIKSLPSLEFFSLESPLRSWNQTHGYTPYGLALLFKTSFNQEDTTPFGERVVQWVLGKGDHPLEFLHTETDWPAKNCELPAGNGLAHLWAAFRLPPPGEQWSVVQRFSKVGLQLLP